MVVGITDGNGNAVKGMVGYQWSNLLDKQANQSHLVFVNGVVRVTVIQIQVRWLLTVS